MFNVQRLVAVGAILATAAVITGSAVWGDPGKDKDRRASDTNIKPADPTGEFAADLDRNPFADSPVIAHKGIGGEEFFALQVQPKLADAAVLPVDYLVVIDTSASKAGGFLTLSQSVAFELSKKLNADDRIALWTANVKPADLSRGFKTAKEMETVFNDLAKEVPLGAVDLEKSLTDALASFDAKAGRRRVLLYLGDGRSVAAPIDTEIRAKLCDNFIKKQVAFFAVPVGNNLDSQNLHGLVSGTGGKVVRHTREEPIVAMIDRLKKDAAEPILYPEKFELTAGVKDVLPTRLPPLRRDQPTLVVGKLPGGAKTLGYTVSGLVGDKDASDAKPFKVPAADPENFFLTNIIDQWKLAKDRPALLPADRALAFSFKQNQVAVETLISRGEMALENDKLDAAKKLFSQAQELAPTSARAKGGIALVESMKAGKKTRKQLLEELRAEGAKREVLRLEAGKRRIVVLDDGEDKKEPEAKEPDPLEDFKQRRAIAGQRATARVNEAVRQANRLVRTRPDEAKEILKQELEDIKADPDLEERTKSSLTTRITGILQSAERQSAVVRRNEAEALALRAAADARLDIRRAQVLAQDKVRERLRVFDNLMDQAREDEAYRQALSIRDDLVNQGLPVPQAVSSAYDVALTGYHLRQVQEMKRMREEKFLATMLEVERSHVPFPDEPPVEFPSDVIVRRITKGAFRNWKDFSKYRTKEYSIATFGADVPGRMFELRDRLNKTVEWGLSEKAPLGEVLPQLSKKFDLTFDVNVRAFKREAADKDILTTEIQPTYKDGESMPKATLATILKRILADLPVTSGATYIVRRDVIEITTGAVATAEKAVRVYPVADLVTPIPNAFNQAAVQQAGSILGALGQVGLAGGGVQLGLAGGLAGGLALGLQAGGIQLGLQVGGLAGGLQVGGLAVGLQAGGLAVGLQAGGLQAGGLQVGLQGGVQVGLQAGAQAGNNLGVGGGVPGFTGGQLGQLGNLGGQFGAQGGDTSQLLMTLIRQVVGRPKDWVPAYNPVTGMPINPTDDQAADMTPLNQDNNSLGYYPPALALVVKAPSMVHTRASSIVITGGGMMDTAAPGEGRLLVNGRPLPREVKVAPDGDDKGKKLVDPREAWQDALARGTQEPGLIIATADYLGKNGKFDHCAEFLKANLRQNVVVKPWVFRSLALSLRESGGSADEIERAEVSVADMEPMDAGGYLLAAKALADDKNYARALAFCKQAAELQPNVAKPYADASRYAEMAGDAKAMAWAAGSLLAQDWPVKNDELQRTAADKVAGLLGKLDKADRAKLETTVAARKQRDLVVKLLWAGEADLDLKVVEPTGSTASALSRQTIGGGTLIGDTTSNNNAETYVAAEGYSGEYRVLVEKVWGKTVGNKAQLKVIRHQGTPRETEELITLRIDGTVAAPVVVNLDNGRRTETAYVPPASAHREPHDVATADPDAGKVLTKLRDLANPELTGFERGTQGGVVSSGRPSAKPFAGGAAMERERLLPHQRVSSFVANTMEVTAQAVLAADRRSVRVSMAPVTNTIPDKPVRVISPIFPGSGR